MKNLTRITFLLAFLAVNGLAQLTTTTTTLSVAIPSITIAPTTQFCVASATNVVIGSLATATSSSYLWVDKEAFLVTGQGTSTTCFKGKRGQLGTAAHAHNSGALVYVGTAATSTGDNSRPFTGGVFITNMPAGACTSTLQYTLPLVVTSITNTFDRGTAVTCAGPTGAQVWVTVNAAQTSNLGQAIASATTIAPSSFVTHITGTTPIATITVAVGLKPGSQYVFIPDAIFTTTNAGNISIASTAVVGKALIMTWDGTKFNPSY